MTSRISMLAVRAALVVGVLGAALEADAFSVIPTPFVLFNPKTSSSIPGIAGRDPNNSGCLTESWGAVVNNCSSSQTWQIPLPLPNVHDRSAIVVVDVHYYAPSSSSAALLSCIGYSVDEWGNPRPDRDDHFTYLSASGAGDSGGALLLNIDYRYRAFLWCTIPQNAKIYGVIYGPRA